MITQIGIDLIIVNHLLQISGDHKNQRTPQDYDAAYSRRKAKKLESLRKTMEKLKVKEAYLLTSESEGAEDMDGGTIKIIPAWKWMLEL